MTITTVGVIGVGVIGEGIAQTLIEAGFRVCMVELSNERLARALSNIRQGLKLQRILASRAGKTPTRRSIDEDLSLVTSSTSCSVLRDCDAVIESVTESWPVKAEVYHQLHHVCRRDCVLVANPSVFPIARISEAASRNDTVVGVHFMNPVPMKEGVETIFLPTTSEATRRTLLDLLLAMGKRPIEVGDSPGFVSNRVMMPAINEAIALVQEGVASAQAVDDVFKFCFAHKMGPLETADLIGLDTVLLSLEALRGEFQDEKFAPARLLVEMVSSRKLGRKSGIGFYDYR